MAEVKFIYKSQTYIIQCQKNELFKDICQRFSNKANIKLSSAYFMYESNVIDLKLTYEQTVKGDNKRDNKMTVLVELNEEGDCKDKNMAISKEIICPTCQENCLIKLKDYKIDLNCKNKHEFNDILLNEYNKYQTVDLSKIICEDCKKQNKSNVFENKFYICISCKKNICPLCKSKHNEDHDIIDYEQKDYTCIIHNDKFSSYCKNCKLNLCIECESIHKDKENILMYRDILPEKDKIVSQMSELRILINQYKEVIEKIKNELDNVIKNYELYYLINDNLMKIYQKKNRNYQILSNLKEISNNNINILNDLNNIFLDNKNFFDIYTKTINIHNKMMNIKNNENIFNDNKVEKKAKINKIINDKKGNNYKKLIYLSMIADQANKFDDMAEFMKKFASERIDDLSFDERNIMNTAFKKLIDLNRSAIRTIIVNENKEKKRDNSLYLSYILEYKEFILDDLIGECQDIIKFIEKICLPKAKENESKSYYLKMLGDYNRYIAEFVEGSLKNKIIDNCNKYYLEADKELKNISFINPNKLELLLKTSFFYSEIMNDSQKAINLLEIAVRKYEEEKKINKINEESDEFKESKNLYNLMKENLDMWKDKMKK